MKKIAVIFAVFVSSLGLGQDYGDSLVNFENFNTDEYQRLIIEHVNNERKLYGLNILVEDEDISETCMEYAMKMAATKKLQHSGNGGYVSTYEVILHGMLVTNLNVSYKTFTYYTVDAWLGEPSHREALMDPDITRIGVGIGLIPQHQYECVRTV